MRSLKIRKTVLSLHFYQHAYIPLCSLSPISRVPFREKMKITKNPTKNPNLGKSWAKTYRWFTQLWMQFAEHSGMVSPTAWMINKNEESPGAGIPQKYSKFGLNKANALWATSSHVAVTQTTDTSCVISAWQVLQSTLCVTLENSFLPSLQPDEVHFAIS